MDSQAADPSELDRQFNARATVADVGVYLERYRRESDRQAATLPCLRDLAYGPGGDEKLDLFPVPGNARAPVFVYLHGGYWRALAKEDSSFMAQNLTSLGIAVAAVNYSLAPAFRLGEIVAQVRRAVAWLWKNGAAHGLDPERLLVAGSSAGGHLAGMVLAGGWQEGLGVPPNVVKGAFGVSGLYDLRQIPATHVNEWLALGREEAENLSPQVNLPLLPAPLALAYAQSDTAEFKRQSRAYAQACRERGHEINLFEVEGKNHFDIVLDWQEPNSELTLATLELFRKTGEKEKPEEPCAPQPERRDA